jgi:tRNA-specific 2-thiouridylase
LTSKARVVVGISGGVDSSVAALLLLEQGYEVHGVFMKNWEDTYEVGYCSDNEDWEDACEVCQTLAIPLHSANFSAQYWEQVFETFLSEHRQGRTPNPDILCNREIKFKAFLDYALDHLGADYIATGHYARSMTVAGVSHLLKGTDTAKDQSYFLYTLRKRQLKHTLFPVGDLFKHQVRALAAENNLVTHDKKDSTGICFIGERRFREFLSRYLPTQPGKMLTPTGEYKGNHMGLMFYTLGQRHGLGIGGQSQNLGEPWYVVDKDCDNNVLVVAQGNNNSLLYHRRLWASDLHWMQSERPTTPFHCWAKSRYRQPDQACVIDTLDTTTKSCQVTFAQPQRALTPGQSIVFYSHEECLGGGVIDAAFD